MNYRLIIDGHDAELNEKVSVALNKKYESLKDPTGYYTDYSKTVNLPMTAVNNQIFSSVFRCDQVVTNRTIDPRKKVDFVLLHNEELVMRGYLKVTNVYNSGKNKYYQINLFSELGGLLNDMKQLTYDTKAEAKYVMPNVLSRGCNINRHIVKNSFIQEDHNLDYNTKTDLDHIGFYCEYGGKYKDFESDKWVDNTEHKIVDEYKVGSKAKKFGERDEHYYHIHRSYYQRPYIWIDSLWQQVKHKMEAISDYKINLDPSFFNAHNPYYSNLIYTLPSLYDTSNETLASTMTEKFGWIDKQYVMHNEAQENLSNHHKAIMPFVHSGGSHIYSTESQRFNVNNGFPVHYKEKMVWWLFAANPDFQLTNGYCRIREDNPIFITVRAVNAYNNAYIPGASFTVMLYSNNLPETSVYYDAAIDCGITSRNHPNVVVIPDNDRGKDQGYWWSGEMTVEFDVNTTEPFYIVADNYAANNADPFEIALGSWIPQWDWLWSDLYYTTGNMSKGHSVYLRCVNAEVEQTSNIRSNAEITMEKLWRSEKSVFDVLLEYAKMFHLVFDLDQDNKVLNIMTRNRYFSKYHIEDWSDKVDRNKDFILQPINFDKKYLIYGYKDGKGQRMEYYQSKYKAGYGEKRIDTELEFNTDEDKLFDKMTPSMISSKKQYSYWKDFVYNIGLLNDTEDEKFLVNEYFPENDAEGSNAEMDGQFYFRNGRQPVDYELSNFGYAYITDDSEIEIKNKSFCWSLSDGLIVDCQYYPAISTYSADGKYSIQFNEPKELYFNRTVVPYNNPVYVYDAFWKDYINERWSVQNKVLTCYMYIDAEDFKRYQFNTFIQIDNVLYLPNAISDFDVTSNGSTKVELVQVYDKSKYLNSHINFAYLYADRNNITLTKNITVVNVYSSSNWRVLNCPEWVGYSYNNDTLSIYSYGDVFLRRLHGRITLINDEGEQYTIEVDVEPQEVYLNAVEKSVTFAQRGESKTVMLDSMPANVSVVSKPSWIEVEFMSVYQRQDNGTLSGRRGNVSVMITAAPNNSTFNRSGNIVFRNGMAAQDTIRVSQNGGIVITRPDVGEDFEVIRDMPLNLNEDTINNLTLHTFKELDLNTLRITNGNFRKKDIQGNDTKNIDIVKYQAVPVVSDTHKNLGKTADGGQIKVNTLDGNTVIWNYNIGSTRKRYTVFISAGEGGYVTVDGKDYYGAYLADVDEGTEILVRATGVDGHVFSQWSDGNTVNPRIMTINSNVVMTAVYDGQVVVNDYVVYDNGDALITDGNDKIIF